MEIATKVVAVSGAVVFAFLLLLVTSKLFIVSKKIDRIMETLKLIDAFGSSGQETKPAS